MLPLKPCTLTPSQRDPNRLPQPKSFGIGMNLVHICETSELRPAPLTRGSQEAVPEAPQLFPGARPAAVLPRSYCTPPNVRMPLRMLALGTALSIVAELAQRKPS